MGVRCGVKSGVWGCRVWGGEEFLVLAHLCLRGSDQWEDDP